MIISKKMEIQLKKHVDHKCLECLRKVRRLLFNLQRSHEGTSHQENASVDTKGIKAFLCMQLCKEQQVCADTMGYVLATSMVARKAAREGEIHGE